MKTDLNFPNNYLTGPIVFRSAFNASSPINANQAWSLFFTAGQADNVFSGNTGVGRFFTNVLLAVGAAGVLWALVFNHAV
jgi:hypothetical protein